MKVIGPLPSEFAAQQGELHIAGRAARHWTAQAGTPCFIYDPAIARTRVERFRAAFHGIDLHYAIKANPFPPLLAALAPLVDGFDVASGGSWRGLWSGSRHPRSASPDRASVTVSWLRRSRQA